MSKSWVFEVKTACSHGHFLLFTKLEKKIDMRALHLSKKNLNPGEKKYNYPLRSLRGYFMEYPMEYTGEYDNLLNRIFQKTGHKVNIDKFGIWNIAGILQFSIVN